MPKKYLALGDSYTIGEAVPQNESFPFQLINRLNKSGEKFADPEIIAKTGWTTGELKSAVRGSEVKPVYDLVTLLIGVNNQYRSYSLGEYKTEFEELLKTAIDRAGGIKKNVIVVSIPDWGVTPFAKESPKSADEISKEIDNFNTAASKITDKYNVKFVDITPNSRNAKTDRSLIAGDGLHPSAKMYADWVEEIIAAYL